MGSLIVGILLVAFALYLFAYPLTDEEKEMPNIIEEYKDEN
jgi:hypothetical protein